MNYPYSFLLIFPALTLKYRYLNLNLNIIYGRADFIIPIALRYTKVFKIARLFEERQCYIIMYKYISVFHSVKNCWIGYSFAYLSITIKKYCKFGYIGGSSYGGRSYRMFSCFRMAGFFFCQYLLYL